MQPLNQEMWPPELLSRTVLPCPLCSVPLLASMVHSMAGNWDMASTKEAASDIYVTGHHLLMLLSGFCPGENKDCLMTVTQEDGCGSQVHVCDIICLSTCGFGLFSARDIDCLLSHLAFVFQVDTKGLYWQKTNQCLKQDLRCLTGAGVAASCLCLSEIELLDLSTLSTQGDNFCLPGARLMFALRPATPKILNSLSDHVSFLTDILNAVLCGLPPWKKCDKDFLLIYLLSCAVHSCDLLASPANVEKSEKTEQRSKAEGNIIISF